MSRIKKKKINGLPIRLRRYTLRSPLPFAWASQSFSFTSWEEKKWVQLRTCRKVLHSLLRKTFTSLEREVCPFLLFQWIVTTTTKRKKIESPTVKEETPFCVDVPSFCSQSLQCMDLKPKSCRNRPPPARKKQQHSHLVPQCSAVFVHPGVETLGHRCQRRCLLFIFFLLLQTRRKHFFLPAHPLGS